GPADLITYLVDALPRRELLDLDLSRQNGGLLIIQQSKKRNFPQCLGIACHELTSSTGIDRGGLNNEYHKMKLDPTSVWALDEERSMDALEFEHAVKIQSCPAGDLHAIASDFALHVSTTDTELLR